jgi:hypothetical protein
MGFFMVRYAVKTGTLAAQLEQARREAARNAATADALHRHVTPADAAKALEEGSF